MPRDLISLRRVVRVQQHQQSSLSTAMQRRSAAAWKGTTRRVAQGRRISRRQLSPPGVWSCYALRPHVLPLSCRRSAAARQGHRAPCCRLRQWYCTVVVGPCPLVRTPPGTSACGLDDVLRSLRCSAQPSLTPSHVDNQRRRLRVLDHRSRPIRSATTRTTVCFALLPLFLCLARCRCHPPRPTCPTLSFTTRVFRPSPATCALHSSLLRSRLCILQVLNTAA